MSNNKNVITTRPQLIIQLYLWCQLVCHIDTYSEESIKYIPRAPMLSAKTNTTWEKKERRKKNTLILRAA